MSRFMLLLPLITACAFGGVTWDGERVPYAGVSYEGCGGHVVSVVANDVGWYMFDGYAGGPSVGQGLNLATITINNLERKRIVNVAYEPCPDEAGPEYEWCFMHNLEFGRQTLDPFEAQDYLDEVHAENAAVVQEFEAACAQ